MSAAFSNIALGVAPDTAQDTAIVALSRSGSQMAQELRRRLPGNPRLYLDRRFAPTDPAAAGMRLYDRPLRPVLQRLFTENRRLILFMPVGVAVRLLAPVMQHKHTDPAVVCVDDAGRFAVSLLSGHIGGGDALTGEVAAILGATPVITSASHALDTLAVDLLGLDFGWKIEAADETITRVSAAVVNGEPVGVYQDAGQRNWWPANQPWPANLTVYPTLESLSQSPSAAYLVITDRWLPAPEPGVIEWDIEVRGSESNPQRPRNMVVYRPRTLIAGIGCRRGVCIDYLFEFVGNTFHRFGLWEDSIAAIATADLKADEPGILELAAEYEVPLQTYSAEQLNQVFADLPNAGLNQSAAAHRLLGLWGVAEPAALLAAGSAELVLPRQKTDRATLAVARIPYETHPT